MLKKISISPLDKKYISIRKYSAKPISVDFKNLFVNKPWGSEYLMYDNEDVEIWHLSIKHQRSTSTHCHPNKRTALLVLEGRALFSSLNESMELLPMDAVILDPGVFHSTQSISTDGLQVLEFENPPMKHDLLRLEDRYGRTEQGYEGRDKMISKKESMRLFDAKSKVFRKLYNNKICIRTIADRKDLQNFKALDLAVVLSGNIKSRAKENLFLLPSIITVGELKELDCSFNKAKIFFIRRK